MILFPNAKINLGLNIVSKRPDNYHNIETIFYPIALQDALEVVPSENSERWKFHQSGIPVNGEPDKNLVIKAYHLISKSCQLPPVDIYLHKSIPFGAGLGGGSADAAFMLRILNDAFKLNIPKTELENLATLLGADVPFFLENKPVFATGIGNIFEPLKISLKEYYLVLVKPDVSVPTAEAYALVKPVKPTIPLYEIAKLPVEKWRGAMKNDFEDSVFAKYPVIQSVKDDLYAKGALYASMSGSGSSVYGIFDHPVDLKSYYSGCFVWSGECQI